MRETRGGTTPITLEKALAVFLDGLSGKNRSAATLRAYQTDLLQLIHFLHDTDVLMATPQDVQKVDILDYFSHLAKKDLTGVARARKMSAIREYFRFLEGLGYIPKSPTTGVETPSGSGILASFSDLTNTPECSRLPALTPGTMRFYRCFFRPGFGCQNLPI
jgi:site-specific recombinase XerD